MITLVVPPGVYLPNVTKLSRSVISCNKNSDLLKNKTRKNENYFLHSLVVKSSFMEIPLCVRSPYPLTDESHGVGECIKTKFPIKDQAFYILKPKPVKY